MRNWHLWVGGTGLILFVLQGQYMTLVIGVGELPDGPRMLHRSAHIYLLLTSVANVVAGCYMSTPSALNILQRLCSVLLLLAGPLLLLSFFAESNSPELERIILKMTLYALFGAALLLLGNGLYQRFKTR